MQQGASSRLASLDGLVARAKVGGLASIDRAWLWGSLLDAQADLDRWLEAAEVREKRGIEAALQQAQAAVREAIGLLEDVA